MINTIETESNTQQRRSTSYTNRISSRRLGFSSSLSSGLSSGLSRTNTRLNSPIRRRTSPRQLNSLESIINKKEEEEEEFNEKEFTSKGANIFYKNSLSFKNYLNNLQIQLSTIKKELSIAQNICKAIQSKNNFTKILELVNNKYKSILGEFNNPLNDITNISPVFEKINKELEETNKTVTELTKNMTEYIKKTRSIKLFEYSLENKTEINKKPLCQICLFKENTYTF